MSGFSNLNRKARPWEYIIIDETTGQWIWNTDAVTDFWGRVVHKDWAKEPNPFEYMDTNFTEKSPTFGSAGNNALTTQRVRYFIQTDDNNVITSFFQSDSYSLGQYTEATSSQVATYTPVIADQSFNVDFDISATNTSTLIATLTATDPSGAGLLWSITTNPSDLFTINSANGKLYVTDPNRLTDATTYSPVIRVTSYFPGGAYDEATITLAVNSENNAPTINSGSSYSINENTTAVITLSASDPENDTLTWSISGGADSDAFSVDSSTGALAFKSAPNYESPGDVDSNNIYLVTVGVTDGTNAVTKDLSITVLDVNEASTITSSSTFTVDENTTTVGTCTATDPEGHAITWSITGGADSTLFSIDSDTGALSFIAAPDYEIPADSGANNVYNVTVGASDSVNTTTQAIAVTVNNTSEATDFGTMLFWYDSSIASSITQSGGAVSQWNDLSGNARHLVQSTTSNKPIYSADGVTTGIPSVAFNLSAAAGHYLSYTAGSNSWANVLINSSSSNVLTYVVVKQITRDSGINNSLINIGSGTLTSYLFGINSNTSGSTFKGVVSHNRTSNNYAHVLATEMSGFNTLFAIIDLYTPNSTPRATLYNNTTSVATSTDLGTMSGATNLSISMFIGCGQVGAGTPDINGFRGHICEIGCFSNFTGTLSNLYTYLQGKWGI